MKFYSKDSGIIPAVVTPLAGVWIEIIMPAGNLYDTSLMVSHAKMCYTMKNQIPVHCVCPADCTGIKNEHGDNDYGRNNERL